jgi:hypothetical protein
MRMKEQCRKQCVSGTGKLGLRQRECGGLLPLSSTLVLKALTDRMMCNTQDND